jgi:hypothetical protein
MNTNVGWPKLTLYVGTLVAAVALLAVVAFGNGALDVTVLKIIGPVAILVLAIQAARATQRQSELSVYWFVWYLIMLFLVLLLTIYGWSQNSVAYNSADWISRGGLLVLIVLAVWRIGLQLRHRTA